MQEIIDLAIKFFHNKNCFRRGYLWEYFLVFFKKSKLNQKVLCLVNLQDSIVMPPNSFFESNKNKELCEQYYQEYKRILSCKKTILSTHLKDTETDDIRVYIDILTSLEIHIHDILSNPSNKGFNCEYVTNLLAKLNGYTHILKEIEEESFLNIRYHLTFVFLLK